MNQHNALPMDLNPRADNTLLLIEQGLNKYLNARPKGRRDVHPMSIEAVEERGAQLFFRLVFGPAPDTVIHPKMATSKGLFYNEDSIQEEKFISLARESLYCSNYGGTGDLGAEFLFVAAQQNTKRRFTLCYPTTIEMVAAEYFQQLTRDYPEDYPEKLRNKAKVSLDRLALNFYMSYEAK